MDVIYEKIRTMCDKLNEFSTIESQGLAASYIMCGQYKKTNEPPKDDAGWQPLTASTLFTGIDGHSWLHTSFKTPKTSGEPRLRVRTGLENAWAATNPQFTVFVNGSTRQAFDTNHWWLPLEQDSSYDIYLYLYNGMNPCTFRVELFLDIVDLETESLYYDFKVPFEALEALKEGSDYITIRDALNKASMLLDLRYPHSKEYYDSVDRTAKYLKEEFYEKLCGKTEAEISCVGHTHIDVAWLWTVAQTREKAQRSFSTALNLMDRYEDYIFMSSQPQLYQHVKENDPVLYERIKQRVKEGRWEVDGAMWLEADTNLASGESLVRQILYGKRFMKEEFGVDSKILWLPDVFGYSGALPQILKKSGVDRFFTAKMSWSDVNKMPDDIFMWEGIDGTSVFTSIVENYVTCIDSKTLKHKWDSFKDKEYSRTQLLTAGYGDGGGGTTYETLENHKRLKYGLPGLPKSVIRKGKDYFDIAQDSFNKNARELNYTPKWVGEMYLEKHRGTYTNMASVKKGNRKSELTQLIAEEVSVIDMLFLNGEYPKEALSENQYVILLNQFHDILPGSSIKEVYDVTMEEYKRVLSKNEEITKGALSKIAGALNTGGGIFVYNPTSFEISDFVRVDGVTYYAKNVPAHGFKVIEKLEAKKGVSVNKNVIENDVIKVTFNNKYHIVSVFDKEFGREIIKEGDEANVLEVFEDYPFCFDGWELNSYYKDKKWIADNVSEVTLSDDGIRIKRKYMQSEIIQDITLRKGSKRIDFNTFVDWKEDHVILKAAFPVDIRNTFATYDIQFGNLQRPTIANTSWDREKFEMCAHKWADLSEADYGVSLLNDCKYGYSIEENVMKLSLLKAATYPNPVADREQHRFTYSLLPHEGDFKNGTIKEAYLLNTPLTAFEVKECAGGLCDTFSIANVDKENVVIESIKKAEDENAVVVRMYESHSKKCKVNLSVGFDFKEAYICDLLENNVEKLEKDGNKVSFNVKNYEIVTVKLVL